MAFKEHLLAGTALEVALATHTGYHNARESKEAAGRATGEAKDYTWWSHHGMHVLVGTVSCWLKFSQDAGLRRFLLSTQQALLVETAPEDGSWGVAELAAEHTRTPSTPWADPPRFGQAASWHPGPSAPGPPGVPPRVIPY